jgi:nuclear GTP-binding protein
MVKASVSNAKANRKSNNKKFIAAKASKATGKGSAISKSAASTNPNRPDPSGGKAGSQFRTRQTINRINMYKAKPDMKKLKMANTDPNAGKIQPDRRWFGNVRVVDQKELEHYRRKLEE